MSTKTKSTKTKKSSAPKKRKRVQTVEIPQERIVRTNIARQAVQGILLPPKVVAQIADQVAKAVYDRVPRRTPRKKVVEKPTSGAFILDTSAIIDGRIFDLAKIGAFFGNFVVLGGVLSELKNIADSKDEVKRERGRRALNALDAFKKLKDVKLIVLDDEFSKAPVDEQIITFARQNKGRILTCDFNLSKKAKISSVVSLDLYEMANILKTQALPGEEFFVKIMQKGKGVDQGVGYLPDGTMLVVEQGAHLMGKTVKVTVARVIQTDAGRIFFGRARE